MHVDILPSDHMGMSVSMENISIRHQHGENKAYT